MLWGTSKGLGKQFAFLVTCLSEEVASLQLTSSHLQMDGCKTIQLPFGMDVSFREFKSSQLASG